MEYFSSRLAWTLSSDAHGITPIILQMNSFENNELPVGEAITGYVVLIWRFLLSVGDKVEPLIAFAGVQPAERTFFGLPTHETWVPTGVAGRWAL